MIWRKSSIIACGSSSFQNNLLTFAVKENHLTDILLSTQVALDTVVMETPSDLENNNNNLYKLEPCVMDCETAFPQQEEEVIADESYDEQEEWEAEPFDPYVVFFSMVLWIDKVIMWKHYVVLGIIL